MKYYLVNDTIKKTNETLINDHVKISLYSEILKVIENNYSNQYFKTPKIAESLNMSLSTLKRKLKQETHITLGKIIYNYRICKAKIMLLNSMPISITAINCGFSSPAHFCTKFKKQIGMTPKDFSKNINM
ncbi:MAG: helix-turn-helix transcriptional regulator [Alcanivoracaceae bacterium]|nr:helix-turn-helix transcriptional regulator [Alcanivoracaceae bacterium]